MKDRWSTVASVQSDNLDSLVHQSRLIGDETKLVLRGGGNTSIKRDEVDFRGRGVRVLRIKGSGSDLRTIKRGDFPGVRLDDVLPLFERDDMSDEDMVAYLGNCLMEPGSRRPSIETLLHAFVPAVSVAHSHADAILSLTNTVDHLDVAQGCLRRSGHPDSLPPARLSCFQRRSAWRFGRIRRQGD